MGSLGYTSGASISIETDHLDFLRRKWLPTSAAVSAMTG